MKLTPIKRGLIPTSGYKSTKYSQLLKEFADSDMEAAMLDGHDCKSASVATTAINQSAKRFGMIGIKAITRQNKVYLIKEV